MFRVLGLAGPLWHAVDDEGLGSLQENAGECSCIMADWLGTAIKTLRIGRKVIYEEGRGPKGLRAERVRPE
jgi:cold shock CspA family protein